MAAHIRRTIRLRPSFTTIVSAVVPLADSCRILACAGRVGPSSSSTPSRRRAQLGRRRLALDLDEVLLLHPVTRVREQLREIAVVREQQQAFGLEIEAPDGKHPRFVGHEIEHRRPAVRVGRGRDVARGFVEQPVHDGGVDHDRHTVERDPIVLGIDAPAEHRNLAVHRDPPVGDEAFTRSPRTDARAREHLLQPLAVVTHRVTARR